MDDADAPTALVEVIVWIRLMRAQRRSLSVVQRRLKAANLPSLEWYDVLLELERSSPLRPRDLQSRLLLAQPNLSRLLDRMNDAGLLTREKCKEDARGLLIRATPAGKKTRARMWPIYAAAIDEAIGDRLSASEAQTLARFLRQLSER